MAEKNWELSVLSELADKGWELTNGSGIQADTTYDERVRATRVPDSILPNYKAFRHGRESRESSSSPARSRKPCAASTRTPPKTTCRRPTPP